jgi:hypothetical protein
MVIFTKNPIKNHNCKIKNNKKPGSGKNIESEGDEKTKKGITKQALRDCRKKRIYERVEPLSYQTGEIRENIPYRKRRLLKPGINITAKSAEENPHSSAFP